MGIVGITGGVDTHADTHVEAPLDQNDGLLGVASFPADWAGMTSFLDAWSDSVRWDRLGWRAPGRGVSDYPGFSLTTT